MDVKTIEALARRMLAERGLRQDVVCRVEPRRAVLSGSTSSFYFKQLAQETIRRCVGPRTIDNRITVQPAAGQTAR